jgi:hypothetical protein
VLLNITRDSVLALKHLVVVENDLRQQIDLINRLPTKLEEISTEQGVRTNRKKKNLGTGLCPALTGTCVSQVIVQVVAFILGRTQVKRNGRIHYFSNMVFPLRIQTNDEAHSISGLWTLKEMLNVLSRV